MNGTEEAHHIRSPDLIQNAFGPGNIKKVDKPIKLFIRLKSIFNDQKSACGFCIRKIL